MLLFKYMTIFLNFINALQCSVRYLLLNLSRIINLDSRSKVKKLTHYSLWLSPQQLVEMNRKCNIFLFYKIPDDNWKILISLLWLNFHIQVLFLDIMVISPKCHLYLKIWYEIDSEYIHFILLICLIILPVSEGTGLSMSNDYFYNLMLCTLWELSECSWITTGSWHQEWVEST